MNSADLAALRREYVKETLTEHSVQHDPLGQFAAWYDEAIAANVNEPTAMTLATSDAHGRPSARVVLLKGVNENGFIFFTNYSSNKSAALIDNPRAELLFFWPELERQIRISGNVDQVSMEESDAYFQSRPRPSQLGAWASQQSSVVGTREELEIAYAELEKKYANTTIPRPQHWGGFIVKPLEYEFWQGRESRLHDRIRYRKQSGIWIIERLSP